jgi:hypothetical protein
MMTDIHEATVEVLTAEVRVLQVGSRQITLSVARQLDEIDGYEITPFGRIETGRKAGSRETAVEVIGRAEDGSLARSVATAERVICRGWPSDEDPDSAWLVCDEHAKADPRTATSRDQHRWTCHYPDPGTYVAWSDLPLIVLAGLR